MNNLSINKSKTIINYHTVPFNVCKEGKLNLKFEYDGTLADAITRFIIEYRKDAKDYLYVVDYIIEE